MAAWVSEHGPMPIASAISILQQACDAVSTAHARGLVLGRLEPSKLIRVEQPDGSARIVVDVSVAQQLGSSPADVGPHGPLPTPYVAPEQYDEAYVMAAAADVWALGAVLYELLTGHPPWAMALPSELPAVVRTDTPPRIGEARPEAPPQLNDVVARCLAPRLAERFATVAELSAALGQVPVGRDKQSGESAPPPVVDENVVFTVYRPKTVRPQEWYHLLAFAHLDGPRADAPPDEPDPIEDMERQVEAMLRETLDEYRDTSQDAAQAIPRAGELTFSPDVEEVEFNPPTITLKWYESVWRALEPPAPSTHRGGRRLPAVLVTQLDGVRVRTK